MVVKNLSEIQIRKVSSFLLDIAKLIFGATVIPLFIPDSQFNVWTFLLGFIVFLLCFWWGLKILKKKK